MKNVVQLIGYAGTDPLIKKFESGKQVAWMSLAVNESFKNSDGERVNQTTWHNLVAWGKVATIMKQVIYKGNEVAIKGRLGTRSHNDKNGIKRFTTEVIVEEIQVITKKQAA
jgi:single-strand DNA-binding protein